MLGLTDRAALAGGGLAVRGFDRPKVEDVDYGDGLMPYDIGTLQLALGCTFSQEVCRKVAVYKANEAARRGYALGGAVRCGLMRDPMNVSACEFFSEDPYLTGLLLKSFAPVDGLGFVFTDSLGQGRFVNRTIDARALNELYLNPLARAGRLAAAVQLDGGRLNGESADGSRSAFDAVARYVSDDAMIFTQYSNEHNADENTFIGAYRLGADNVYKREIVNIAAYDTEADKDLKSCAARTLACSIKAHDFYKKPLTKEMAEATLPELAIASAVLLKNDGALPVRAKTVSVFGNAADFEDGAKYSLMPVKDAAKRLGAFNVFLITDYEENGIDPQAASVICGAATAGTTVLVICGLCATPIDFADKASAIIYCPVLPRVRDVIDMLTVTPPQGRLPFTWCRSPQSYPCNDKRFAERGDFRYESMYNGYLLFNNFKTDAVVFPFGHGGDFSAYELSKLNVKSDGAAITAEFVVKNVGEYAGEAVCQAYITLTSASVYGITKRLAAVKRVPLERTENARVELKIDLKDFAVYDENSSELVVLGGKYRVEIGLSSTDIRLSADVKVAVGSRIESGLNEKTAPSYYAIGERFKPTAPEIEKLLKVPFIKKPDECPELALPPPSAMKKPLKKAEKLMPKYLRPLLRYKIKTTPAKNTER